MSATVNRVVSTSPQAPEDVVTDVGETAGAAVQMAYESARRAQRAWMDRAPNARAHSLGQLADALAGHRDELAALIVREVGKPVAEARGEIERAVAIVRYYAQMPLLATGDHFRERGGLSWTDRLPHGVAGLITPWNFPVAIPLWKAAPALAAGNAVLIKPAPEGTACALALADVARHCLPEGLLSVLPGGASTGAALVETADVLSFTGSTVVGRAVAARAAQRGVPVQAELGGSNVSIVLPGADLEATAASIAAAATGFAGQKCTATSRIVAVDAQFSELVEALTAAWSDLSVGDPSLEGTTVGPVISAAARDRVLEAATHAGGSVIQPARLAGKGWMVAPTLVVEPSPGAAVLDEEVFGPIACVSSVPDLAAAVRSVNHHPLRLVTSVYGNALDEALSVVDELRSGMVKVNRPTTGVDYWLPFGGSGESSYGGRELGTAALDFFTTTRTVSISGRV